MKNIIIKLTTVFVLASFLFLTGCASNLLLTKNQKELVFKPNEGGVIFSFQTAGAPFRPNSLSVQEINQYKKYSAKRLEVVPVPVYGGRMRNNLYLCNIKLPKGIYRLAYFYGITGFVFGSEFYMPCNKIFDVSPGKVTYLGRIGANLYYENRSYSNEIVINDYYDDEDYELFVKYFPILKEKHIKKDLLY